MQGPGEGQKTGQSATRLENAGRSAELSALSPWVVRTGHVMAAFLILSFVLMFVNSIRQLDFWKEHFFRDTLNAGESCSVTAVHTNGNRDPAQFEGATSTPITLPHVGKSLKQLAIGKPGSTLHAIYNCLISTTTLRDKQEMIYLHTGWIRALDTKISVEGMPRVSFQGMDKPIVPLGQNDFAAEQMRLTIDILAESNDKAGVMYASPFVVSQGTSENFRVLGVDYALAIQKTLYAILPVLTLGIILAFGWFIGLRTRILIVTFMFFGFTTAWNMLWIFNDIWPWTFSFTRDLSEFLVTGSLLAFTLFALEMFGFMKTWVPRLCVGLVVAITLSGLFAYFVTPEYQTTSNILKAIQIAISAGLTAIVIYGVKRISNMRRTSPSEVATKNMLRAMVALVCFALLAIAFDLVASSFGFPVRLIPHLFKLLPLFVGGVVLYSLYLIEQQLQEEQGRRTKIENELNLAAKLQNVLLPAKLKGEAHGFSYRIESEPHGILGGDWVKVHSAAERSLVILGDVVGKGASAALTHSGIAAAWESRIKDWAKGSVSAAELLSGINETMFDLFRGDMNTTFAAAEIEDDGKVHVAAGGNYWLHLNVKRSRPVGIGTRSLLGVSQGLELQFQELQLEPGDWLVCFTDGVLEGNRPVKRFLQAVQSRLTEITEEELRNALFDAGADDVHPDDASMLLLQYKRPQKAAGAA